ncbi:MAG: S8 family serine peptidase [Gammaproteobacteria bacterium]
MYHYKKNKLRLDISLLALSCSFAIPAAMASENQIADQKVKFIAGEKYTFTKYVDNAGNIRSEILDGKGEKVDERALPNVKRNVVDPRVLSQVQQLEDEGRMDDVVVVNVALELPEPAADEMPESGAVEEEHGHVEHSQVNGKSMTAEELDRHVKANGSEQRVLQAKRNRVRAENLKAWGKRHGLSGQKGLERAALQGRTGATLNLTAKQLRQLLDSNDQAVVGIELYEPDQDTISSAMDATSISTSALPYSSTRGSNIGIYMTESGCADESRITSYDRLSGTETDHSRNVGGIIRAISPNSYLYCRGGAVLPESTDLDGVGGNPPIYIINRSNGGNETSSYNTWDRDWDNFVYNNNIATFISAGNNTNGTGNIISPAKGLNAVAVGNYNDATSTIAGSSAFVDPETGNNKPEVSAPGTNITAGGFTMSGTSMSSPHAAAFTADMMSGSTYLMYKPYLAKAKLLAGATDPISGGYDKVGLGGIDFASAQWSGYYQWYSGSNSSFSTFDSDDGNADGYVEKRIYITSSWDKVRVVLSWLNRGSYVYDHRTDAHPIGMDLDLQVYDPNGAYVGSSASWDNSFERVEFTPTVSGYYSFKIKRYANRDTSSALRMGLYVNYYNQ